MKPSSLRNDRSIESGIVVAVLAAGRGTRFGGGKLDADLGGRPVGQWATDTAEHAGFLRRLIVTAPQPPRFAGQLQGWERVINHAPENGIAGSIRAAAEAANPCKRLVIMLADMPFIEPEFLRALAQGSAVTFTEYPGGKFGVPAAFPARVFENLASLTGEQGAASLDWGEAICLLPPDNAASLRDIDTQDILSQIVREL